MSNVVFKLGELFCGPGGMALGAKLASEVIVKTKKHKFKNTEPIQHIWGVDIDQAAIKTYKRNLPGVGICVDAIKFTDPNGKQGDVPHISEYDKINALAFGFPCNDFSMVGKQKGFNGKFGNLYKAGINAINHSDPLFFIAENVSGIHSANSGASFQKILKELANAGKHGYEVTTHLYKFEKYGVPQTRHRYIIIGIRKDQKNIFRVPAETTTSAHKTAKSALTPKDEYGFNIEHTRQSDQVIWRLKLTPPGANAWKLDDIIQYSDSNLEKYLKYNLTWYETVIKPLGNITAIREKVEYCKLHCTRAKMSHIYRRLDANKPSYTITGSGGGGTHVYHWEEPRALTNRERARLQSFPDYFEFMGSKEQSRKQIGMAVPPDGASLIFQAIIKTFIGEDYKSIPANYTPMIDELLKKHIYNNYRNKLRDYLKKNHDIKLNDLNVTQEDINSWIDSDMSFSDTTKALTSEYKY